MSSSFQFRAQLRVVVDLAIKSYHAVAIVGTNGLVTGLEIDNLQPGGSHRNQIGFEYALLIGTTVNECSNGRLNSPGAWRKPDMSESGYSAHVNRIMAQDCSGGLNSDANFLGVTAAVTEQKIGCHMNLVDAPDSSRLPSVIEVNWGGVQ